MPLERVEIVPRLRPRTPDSHKGTFGTVLVVAGSRGMPGAAALVGKAALRSGAGLVRVACPQSIHGIVAGFEPAYMTWPLAEDASGRVRAQDNLAALKKLATSADVLAIGPGLTAEAEVPDLVLELLGLPIPAVVDADALNALVARNQVPALFSRPRPTIITPHPGEFSRLTGTATNTIQADRIAYAERFVNARKDFVLVLKGAESIVADEARLFINPTGNPGMATGGAGDVLTGVIAGLWAQRLAPFEAACLGAYVHGLAGNVARDRLGEVSLIASDIIDALPAAFRQIEHEPAVGT